MKRFNSIFLSIVCLHLVGFSCFAQENKTAFDAPPSWAKEQIWYQIMVERFYNGDKTNDPTAESANVPPIGSVQPPNWAISKWTDSWHKQEAWAAATGKPLNDLIYNRRYGGDLQGVLDKLGYLQELGVTGLFLNPINDAPSLHKYDASSYHHVDKHFGNDPVGDAKIIAQEDPNDPTTWQWTSADKLFLKLIEEVHKRKMKIIMDYSWNHTGTLFWAWQDILKNQSQSKYKDWYEVTKFDDPTTPANEFAYKGWANVNSLPELKKVDLLEERKSGHIHKGNIHPAVKAHIFAVTKRWLAPNGNISKGIDGYRLDVADQIGSDFWQDYRKFVRKTKADAYLMGEIWWEKWPDRQMNPAPYTNGDMFDAVMFYQVYSPARYFFSKNNFGINAAAFRDSLNLQWGRLRPEIPYSMMNVSSSHDAPRLLTDFANPNKYKYHANTHEDPSYNIRKPTDETYKRLQLYLLHLFTTIGAPQIWNGEEMGMWGADDPHCRKPLWWKEFAFEPETHIDPTTKKRTTHKVGFNKKQFEWYQKLIKIRKENPVLVSGSIEFIRAEGKTLVYKRKNGSDELLILFNANEKEETFSFDKGRKYVDLLTNKKMKANSFRVKPLTGMILKVL